MASRTSRYSATETTCGRRLYARLGSILILFAGPLLTANLSLASWTDVIAIGLKRSCDPLRLGAAEGDDLIWVDELGTDVFPQDETQDLSQAQTPLALAPFFPRIRISGGPRLSSVSSIRRIRRSPISGTSPTLKHPSPISMAW